MTDSVEPGLPEAYQALPILLPQIQPYGFQAFPQGKRLDRLQHRDCLMTLPQPIVGDSGAGMVDMMKTDVSRDPV